MFFSLCKRIQSAFCLDLSAFKRTKFTKLNNRSLLILQGPDSHKLLQGLITNDLRELGEQVKGNQSFHRVALFTLFLQPKGKILTDAFIIKPRSYKDGRPIYLQNEFWIDIDREAKAALKQHLHKHLWRKQASVIDIENEREEGGHIPTIYSGYNEDNSLLDISRGISVELQEFKTGENDTYANLIYFDPRGSNFGLRIIASQENIDVEGHFDSINESEHQRIIGQLGMSPRRLFENRLPFQYNFDLLHAISLKKGCYIGQEIISRGFLTGVIRKRVFPFELEDSNFTLTETNSSIKLDNGDEVGKILTFSNGSGLALINYLPLYEQALSWPLPIQHPSRGKLHSPFHAGIEKYIQEIKGKQKTLQELEL